MSVINKMLQELDRRNAAGAASAEVGAQAVKPVGSVRRGHEWFWRILAVLVVISVGWVGWVAYQLQPRSVVTPLALKAAERPAPRPVLEEKPAPVPPTPEVVQAKPEPVAPPETFKLARSIETPIAEPRPPLKAEAKKPALQPVSAPKPPPSATKPPPAAAKAPVPATKIVLDQREQPKAVNDTAETRFRRAVALLNQARVSEAEEQLAAALQADPAHVPARQAYVALLLEQQRVASAMRLLREAVDANPTQPTFSLGLARVYAEQRDYPAALAVIEKAGPAAQGGEFQALRAAVLQRLGRHEEAVSAYEQALQKPAQQAGGNWTGLAISLEALGRQAEAAQAYKRALGAGPLPPEVRDYAEARIRALR